MTSEYTTAEDDAPALAAEATTYPLAADATPSEAVVDAVARETDRDALTVAPLYDAVDPDALNDVFGRRSDGLPGQTLRVRISYGDCDVWVDRESVHVRRR